MKIIFHQKWNKKICNWIFTIKYYGDFEVKNKEYTQYNTDCDIKIINEEFRIVIGSLELLISWFDKKFIIKNIDEKLQLIIDIMRF